MVTNLILRSRRVSIPSAGVGIIPGVAPTQIIETHKTGKILNNVDTNLNFLDHRINWAPTQNLNQSHRTHIRKNKQPKKNYRYKWQFASINLHELMKQLPIFIPILNHNRISIIKSNSVRMCNWLQLLVACIPVVDQISCRDRLT